MLGYDLNVFLRRNKLKIDSVKAFKNGQIWICSKTEFFKCCLKCGSDQVVRSGKATTTVREEPLRDQPLWLKIHKHRIYCKSCKKISVEPVDGVWPKRRSTQRFRKFIAKNCSRMTDLSMVSRLHNVSHGFAYQVYYEQTEVKLREYQSAQCWPEVVGIDEHFFKRRMRQTQFVTMITDLKKRRVFDLVEGKDQKQLLEKLEDIPGRENVKIVVIDMSSSFKSFARKMFPNAKLVADKFHVLRLFTPHLMKAGKKIHGHRGELKTRRKLLYSRQNLDYFIRSDIDRYLKDHDELRELYEWKERLMTLYRIKGYDKARRSLGQMIEQMKNSKIEGLQKLSRTFKKWKEEILRYFEKRYTNAFTERMNGTGKLVQRRAFGYKNFRNYRLRTLSACLFKTL